VGNVDHLETMVLQDPQVLRVLPAVMVKRAEKVCQAHLALKASLALQERLVLTVRLDSQARVFQERQGPLGCLEVQEKRRMLNL
jgi:hypothetical protein